MARNLVERELRKRALGGGAFELRTKTQKLQSEPRLSGIGAKWAPAYFAIIGALAGFLGSVVSLALNVIGAWLLGLEPVRLLRVYATIAEGATALDPGSMDFFTYALLAHLGVGTFFGVVFLLLTWRWLRMRTLREYLAAGAIFGVALWLVNFYFILSWLQPMVHGEAFVLTHIPWLVAVLTHASYGLTVALVAYPFRADVE